MSRRLLHLSVMKAGYHADPAFIQEQQHSCNLPKARIPSPPLVCIDIHVLGLRGAERAMAGPQAQPLLTAPQRRPPAQAKAITQLEQKAQAEQRRAEEIEAEVLQLQEKLREAEASHSQALQALGARLRAPPSCDLCLCGSTGKLVGDSEIIGPRMEPLLACACLPASPLCMHMCREQACMYRRGKC